MTFLGGIDRWLFAAGSSHALAVARTLLAATIGLRVALGPYRGLADQPEALFHPVPVLAWLDAMPPVWVLVAAQVVGTLAAVLALANRRPQLALPVAWLAVLFLAGLRSSAGKVLHNDVLLLLASVPFLLAPLAEGRFGEQRRSARWGFPFRAALVVVGLAYLITGMQKLRHSGLSWVTSDNMRWIMDGAARSERSWAPDLARFIADTPWLATIAAAGLLSFELAFVLCVFAPQLRPLALAGAFVLHGSTALLLGLDYWPWVAVGAVVLVDWDAVGGIPALSASARPLEPDHERAGRRRRAIPDSESWVPPEPP